MFGYLRLRHAWLIVLFPLSLMATGCGSHAAGAASEEQQQPATIEIGTVNPIRKDLTREIDQPGALRPIEETRIFTKIAGFAKEPKVDRGDRVKKGDMMVELYLPEVVQDLRVKAAKVQQAKADLTQAKEAAQAAKAAQEAARSEIEAKKASIRSADAQVMRWQAEDVRSRNLLNKGVYDQQTADEVVNQLRASEASRDEAKANLVSAQSKLDQAVAQYHKAQADIEVAAAMVSVAEATHDQWREWLSYAQVKAPFDGFVDTLNFHTGDFLQPSNSQPLFVVVRTDIMRCTIEVPELDAGLIKEHDKAVVRLQAMPGIEIPAEVTRFSNSFDNRARTLCVECYLKNADGALRPGMYANVKIMAKLRNAWILPPEAIMSDILADGDRSYCYVVEEGKAHKVFIEVGTRGDEGVQVLSKQKAGGKREEFTGNEAVVITNPKALQDGQVVKVQAPSTHGPK